MLDIDYWAFNPSFLLSSFSLFILRFNPVRRLEACDEALIPYTLIPVFPRFSHCVPCRKCPIYPTMNKRRDPNDYIPDVRDGLTRKERAVLVCLHDLQKENGDRNVPTILLWGELIDRGYDISRDELNGMLARLGAMNF